MTILATTMLTWHSRSCSNLLILGVLLCGAAGQGCQPRMFSPIDARPGCDQEPDDDPSVTARLLLGVNEDGMFRELQDGDNIAVHRGSQGGIHTFFSLRIEGVDRTDSLLVGQRITFVDDHELAAPELELPVRSFQAGDGYVELLDYLVFLFDSQNTVRDRLVDVEMSVRDPNDALDCSAAVTLRFVDAS
jgi:hypothetical protein